MVKGKWERSRCSRYRLDVVRNLSAQGYVPDRDALKSLLFSSIGICLGFAFSYMMLPLFAYFLNDWRDLLLW
ncbi:hypothetical protein PAMP_007284 [Pampus punctatissimus]